MWKKPHRPRNDGQVTQVYNSGMVSIYAVSNGAAPGYQPVEVLTEKLRIPFEEQALGINRLYLSRQNQAEIRRVIRVQRRDISPQDVAILHDGRKYRIDTVQAVQDVYPPSVDLALVDIQQDMEEAQNGMV